MLAGLSIYEQYCIISTLAIPHCDRRDMDDRDHFGPANMLGG
jgi:hypothetical protein